MWHFAGEATEVLTHADSRVWSTLLPLVTRPEFLSREFFAGRRARYLQPFRLYGVWSVMFLLLANFLNNGSNAIGTESAKVDDSSCLNLQTDLPGAQWLRPRLIVACQKIVTQGGHELGQSIVQISGVRCSYFCGCPCIYSRLIGCIPRVGRPC